jgi:hypothetical protein
LCAAKNDKNRGTAASLKVGTGKGLVYEKMFVNNLMIPYLEHVDDRKRNRTGLQIIAGHLSGHANIMNFLV